MTPPILNNINDQLSNTYVANLNQNQCLVEESHQTFSKDLSRIMGKADMLGHSHDYATQQILKLVKEYPEEAENLGLKPDYLFIKKNIVAPTLEQLQQNRAQFAKDFNLKNDNKEAIISFVSNVLDLIPVVGSVKGAIEGVIGRDMEGNELALWERILGVAPYVKGLKKFSKAMDIARGREMLDHASDLFKNNNEANKNQIIYP